MPVSPAASTPMERIFRRIDFEQLKVPLGFIRLLEAIFCLIVFIAFHGWRFNLKIQCPQGNTTYHFSNLRIDEYEVKCCNGTKTTLFEPDFGSGTDFYAYLIPFSLLVTTSGVLFYLFCFNQYASDDRIPVLDLIVAALLTAGWAIGTMSFSMSARAIGEATSEAAVNKTMEAHEICHGVEADKCSWQSSNVYGALSVATLAGVGLFILFGANIWFIYKETPFFRERQARNQHNNLPAMEPYTLE